MGRSHQTSSCFDSDYVRCAGGRAYWCGCICAVVLVGLLNPLLCFVHCAIDGGGHRQVQHGHVRRPVVESTRSAIYAIPHDSSCQTHHNPFPTVTAVPRALYECLATALALLTIPALAAYLLPEHSLRQWCFALIPFPPPPKALA